MPWLMAGLLGSPVQMVLEKSGASLYYPDYRHPQSVLQSILSPGFFLDLGLGVRSIHIFIFPTFWLGRQLSSKREQYIHTLGKFSIDYSGMSVENICILMQYFFMHA